MATWYTAQLDVNRDLTMRRLTADRILHASLLDFLAPTVTINAATEVEANTALLDINATTLTADGTTATHTFTSVTVTAANVLDLSADSNNVGLYGETGAADLYAPTNVTLAAPILRWVADGNGAFQTPGSGGFSGVIWDLSTARPQVLAYEGNNLAATLLYGVAASSETFVGAFTHESGGAYLLQHTRPSTDVRSPPTHVIAGRATSLTSGSTTAANKVGPHLVTELGRAQTIGTDAAGSWFVGLGDAVSNAVANGMVFGTGAASGTPGTDAYRPYTAEIMRLRQSTTNVGELAFTTAGSINALNGGISVTAAAGALQLTASSGSGNITLSSQENSSIFTGNNFSITCLNLFEIGCHSPSLGARYVANSGVEEHGTSALFRHFLRWVADTVTTDDTLTTLATFTPTTRPSTYEIHIHAFTASGAACAYWSRRVRAVLRSGSAVIDGIDVAASGATPDKNDAGATLSTAALTIDVSTTTIRVRGAGIAATNLTWAVNVYEVK